jgi:hypothetical protein
VLFSLIILGLDGHLISTLRRSHEVCVDGLFCGTAKGSIPSFAGLGVATAILILVSIIPIIIINILRKGAITSFVTVELGQFFFLWIMRIATFSDTAGNTSCNSSFTDGDSLCSQTQAVEAFSFLAFLAWFILFAYWILLLVFSLLAYSKDNTKIWLASTCDVDFSGASEGIPVYNTSYPTQQHLSMVVPVDPPCLVTGPLHSLNISNSPNSHSNMTIVYSAEGMMMNPGSGMGPASSSQKSGTTWLEFFNTTSSQPAASMATHLLSAPGLPGIGISLPSINSFPPLESPLNPGAMNS